LTRTTLVDANLLLYAADPRSPFYRAAATWLERVLNGDERVGMPWQTIGAFFRISTHPRLSADPLSVEEAAAYVRTWLESEPVWVPPATGRTAAILGQLLLRHHVTGNLVTDAQLAALAIEHGVEVYSADSDFARFPEVRWRNPLG